MDAYGIIGNSMEIMIGRGTRCHGLVGVVVFHQRLDSMILEIFPKLNDSMIPWFYKQPSQSTGR